MMTTYYVATLARYVLVDATTEQQARERGQAKLNELFAEDGREAPVVIRTVRIAALDEIELARFHAESLANEKANGGPTDVPM